MPQETLAAPDYALPEDVVLTTSEAAHMMRVSVRTLERLAETGEGPARVRLGARRIGYWRADLLAWLQARTSPAKRAA